MQHLAALRQETRVTQITHHKLVFAVKQSTSSFWTILAVIAWKNYPILKLQNSFRNKLRVGLTRIQSELTQTIAMSVINLCKLWPSEREAHWKTSFRKVTIIKPCSLACFNMFTTLNLFTKLPTLVWPWENRRLITTRAYTFSTLSIDRLQAQT